MSKKYFKIAISGAHGVGKTTLVDEIRRDGFFSGFKFIKNQGRNILNEGYKLNEQGNDATQLRLLEVATETAEQNDNIIADRCILDLIAYTTTLYRDGKIGVDTFSIIRREAERLVKNFDVIFYIQPEFDLEDDGIRSTNTRFRSSVIFWFRHYIDVFDLDVVRLGGSLKTRINQMKQHLIWGTENG